MRSSQKKEVDHTASRIMTACQLLQDEKIQYKAWREMVEFALREAHNIVHPPVIPLENKQLDETKESRMALLQWAKDTRVIDFVNQKHIMLNRKTVWRWIDADEIPGMIWALPTLRGIPRITDGMIVYCEKPDGTVFQGHLDWFIKDMIPKTVLDRPARAHKEPKIFAELFLD